MAVSLVVLHHFIKFLGLGVGRNLFAIVLYRILDAGWFGVDIFFVLSGFLITGIILKDRSNTSFWSVFYARRGFRILPAFGAIFVGTLIAAHFFVPEIHISVGYILAAIFFVANWTILAHEVPIFAHLWSLAVEEQFYVLWPQAAKRLKNSTLINITLSLAVTSELVRLTLAFLRVNPYIVYKITPTRLDGLSIGAALAVGIAIPSVHRFLRVWWKRVALVAAVTLPVIFLALGGNMFEFNVWSQVLTIPPVIVLTAMLIFGSVESALPRRLKRFFGSSIMSWLGRRSYALYLIHQPVLILLERSRAHGYLQRLPIGIAVNAVLLITGIAVCLILAEASWALIESPAQHLRRRWLRNEEGGNRANLSEEEAITSLASQSRLQE